MGILIHKDLLLLRQPGRIEGHYYLHSNNTHYEDLLTLIHSKLDISEVNFYQKILGKILLKNYFRLVQLRLRRMDIYIKVDI